MAAVVIVVMIVPITLGVPASLVFVPPAMAVRPAILPRFVEFMPPMLGLLAVPAMTLDGFVQLVVGLDNAVLAIVAVRIRDRRSGKRHQAKQRGKTEYSFEKSPSLRIVRIFHFALPGSARLCHGYLSLVRLFQTRKEQEIRQKVTSADATQRRVLVREDFSVRL